MSHWCWRCLRPSLRSPSSSAVRAPTCSNRGQRSNHEHRAGHLHGPGGYRRLVLLPGGHSRVAPLSRSANPPARVNQGGQSRPRTNRARSVAADERAGWCAEAPRCVVARPIVGGDDRAAHCTRGAARDAASMTIGFALDSAIAVLVVAVSCWTIIARASFAAVVGFVSFGLLLTLVWVRLDAVDVALTEAAIGSGLTGALLLAAAARLRTSEFATQAERPSMALRVATALLSATATAALAGALFLLPSPAPTLAPAAAANAGATGLGNPVTNVLIAFRTMDTMLEKVVLLLALVGVWSLASDRSWGGPPSPLRRANTEGPLAFLARLLTPLGIVVGIYILWEGADHPGGAFQGGTILAAMWLLLMMSGLANAPAIRLRSLRLVLIAGPTVFLVIGLGGMWLGDAFLAYPVAYAKLLILVIEFVMTLTIAVTLALLLAGPPTREASR